jgi:hypothetical protein
MQRKRYTCLGLFLFTFIALLSAQQSTKGLWVKDPKGKLSTAKKEKRIALLIGNSQYTWWSALETPKNDVQLISDKLSEYGFEVEVVQNLNRDAFTKALERFESKIHLLQGAGNQTVALLYYAGHGLEASGVNYLIPIGDTSSCRTGLRWTGVKLTDIQDAMSAATMRILCIDACRDQPLPFTCDRGSGVKKAQGFRNYTPEGMFVSFSTQPGNSAMDRSPNNPQYSPYALALVKAMEEGKEIKSIFARVSRLVATHGHGQTPVYYAGYVGDFYFSLPDSPEDTEKHPAFSPKKLYAYSGGTVLGLTLTTVGTLLRNQTLTDWKDYYSQTPTDPDNKYATERQKFVVNERMAVAGGILALACGTLAAREWFHYRKNKKLSSPTSSMSLVVPKISPEGLGFIVKF